MAGRGVDIMLGGNADHLTRLELRKLGVEPDDESWQETYEQIAPAIKERVEADHEKVKELGGLFILGTERHESRRIDNQLRGRSGREGDPGESRFSLSAEDDLVRLFAGDRIYRILDRLGPVDEEGREQPIEAKMLSRTIENAQKKVEQQNFLIRKRVLEYDDVMNEQRRIVYKFRNEILEGKDMGVQVRAEIGNVIERTVNEFTPGDFIEDWDLDGLFASLDDIFPVELLSAEELTPEETDRSELVARIQDEAIGLYDEREAELGDEVMRAVERYLLLQFIDTRWREHLYDMDYLREGIHLRGFAQIEPIVAYKNEAFTLFADLMNTIWSDFTRMVFNLEFEAAEEEEPERRYQTSGSSTRPGRVSYSGGSGAAPSALAMAAAGGGVAEEYYGEEEEYEAPPPVEQRVLTEEQTIGRNDPCWCGSGKKFKKCHGA
jgi:preprotein translocase subunit SecA